MGNVLKVQGHNSLIRDVSTNAIVNTNVTEYSLYMKRIQARHESSDKIRCLVKEINTLKTELREIKKLIKGKLI
jgi:hypothetical protein